MFIFSNRTIENIPSIDAFLEEEQCIDAKVAVGWGRKPSFQKAFAIAEQLQIACLCVEDGFIRSLGLGKQGYPPLSLVVDHQGIYFDAYQRSDLEQLIDQTEDTALNQRSDACIRLLLRHKITKYNQKFVPIDAKRFSASQNILIVDQTYADQSIRCAGADAATFKQMLQQARLDHPEAMLWLKVHPDVIEGKAKGHFAAQDLQLPNVQLITEAYHPIELMLYMDEVYVVSSQLGFEALLCGKTVHCFGLPWYAGWGLTDDQYAPTEILNGRRQQARSLSHLFGCAYLQYARYISPLTAQRCQLEQLLQQLIPNLAFQQTLASTAVLYGFSPWKKKFLKQFLDFPQLKISFQRYLKPPKTRHVVAWGKKAHKLRQQGYQQLTTVEDGFIRSIGLGASLIRPCSLVFDDIGIYYDATRPSRLEQLLNQCDFDQAQLQCAERLRQKIIALNISKYNVGERKQLDLSHIQAQKILVVGQVEDDMSVQLGGIDIKTNLDLLAEVRAQHPEAYIVYKPHPDVSAGLRKGAIPADKLLEYADRVEASISIVECFSAIDELHTLTSLSGFEALIRGLKVVCYGMPFYAGWGLTVDRHIQARRTRRLSLQELLYAVLVQYPTYNLATAHDYKVPLTNVESVIEYIESHAHILGVRKSKRWHSLFLSYISFKQRL